MNELTCSKLDIIEFKELEMFLYKFVIEFDFSLKFISFLFLHFSKIYLLRFLQFSKIIFVSNLNK